MSDLIWDDLDVWYVNLDRRPDRREHVEEELLRAGFPAWRRLRGLLPSEVRVPKDQIQTMLDGTPGAIGCHYSQRTIVEKAERSKLCTLVLEDDVMFCNDFRDRFEYIAEFLNQIEWDIFWLGGTFHVNPPVWHKDTIGYDVQLTDTPRILRTYGIWSTYAWIVNGDRAGHILQVLDQNVKGSIGIDALFIKKQPELKTYCYVPGCVKQRDDRSNIGLNPDGTAGYTKFSGFAKLGPYWFQPRALDFDFHNFNWAEAKR